MVGQQGLLPLKTDPKLWVCECRPGCEREVVICLLQKFNDMAAAGTPLGIKSTFCHDHLKVGALLDGGAWGWGGWGGGSVGDICWVTLAAAWSIPGWRVRATFHWSAVHPAKL